VGRGTRRLVDAGLMLVAAVAVGWTQGHWFRGLGTRIFLDAVTALAAAAAAAACLWRAQRIVPVRRAPWRLWGAGCACWAAGQLAYSVLDVVTPGAPHSPSWADALFLAILPLWSFGILALLVGSTANASRLRTLLDGLLIGASILFIAQAFVLRPLLVAHPAGALGPLVALAYPLGDLTLVTLLLLVASRVPPSTQRVLAWFGVAVLFLAVGDVAYWMGTDAGGFVQGNWPDVGWLACFLVVCHVALSPMPALRLRDMPPPGLATSALILVPFVAATGVAVYAEVTEGSLRPGLFWNAILTVSLLALRQLVALAESISLRRRAEASLAQVKDLEGRRTLMLNTVAHDILSPLTAVRIQLRLLGDGADERQARRLAIVARNVETVRRLAADLRDVANLEAGRFRIETGDVDLAEVARNAAESFRDAAAEAGLALLVQADTPLPVRGDRARLAQVLNNLVSNAVRYTPNGTITVRASRAGGHARVVVQDTGRGLRPEDAERLFRPFSQVHAQGEGRERGSGLGLYISRSIAEAHGGRLAAASDGPGRGSTFTLEMPLADGATRATPAARPASPPQPQPPSPAWRAPRGDPSAEPL